MKKWKKQYFDQENFDPQKRGGLREMIIKVDDKTIHNILATVFDFPTWSTKKRISDLMAASGVRFRKDPISKSTVNGILKKFRLTTENTRFSAPAKNSNGLWALRTF